MKGDYRGYDDDKDNVHDDRYLRARPRRSSRGE